MYSSIISGTILGLKSFLINVEVDFSQGFPCFVMVGSLGAEIKESAERVRTALKNSGMSLPPMHISVNLSPADIKKYGTGFDLPIAAGLLTDMKIIDPHRLQNTLVLGELGLNGEVKKVSGVLPIVWEAVKQGVKRCIVPEENANEALLVPGIEVIGVADLISLVKYLNKELLLAPKVRAENIPIANKITLDFKDVIGQENIKRGAMIAAAGFHHFLISGPPGTGKSMIAKRIPSILPPLDEQESMDVTSIYSVAGKLNADNPIIKIRPFVSPHHSISTMGMVGGGSIPKPGAISLAHKGVLFLDELPEFSRQSIDMLRQPLEDKKITIVRAAGNFTYPADIMLVAAMNPCPCGYYPDRNKCSCTPAMIQQYVGHISGPILDRIDICLSANPVAIKELQNNRSGLSSESMGGLVRKARECQNERFKGTDINFNSELGPEQISKYCHLEKEEETFIVKLSEKLNVSARAYHRIIRVARTIADLDASEKIRKEHLAEAAGYRPQLT